MVVSRPIKPFALSLSKGHTASSDKALEKAKLGFDRLSRNGYSMFVTNRNLSPRHLHPTNRIPDRRVRVR